jgi:glycosyltransferase involved in cell wall biosynthesis
MQDRRTRATTDRIVMQPRKYLFYMPALAGGGAERVWALLASAFAAAGHEVLFAVDFEMPENAGFLAPAVRLVALDRGHLQSVVKLSRLIRAEKPHVTFSGIGAANLKHVVAALLAGRHRRAVISYHGFFPSEPQKLSALGNRLTPLLTRLCGRAIAVSDGLRQALEREHGANPARLVRIYNPVDPLGAPHSLGLDALRKREPRVLFVGRFAPDKDLPTLLDAFSRLKTPDAVLDLVGDGPLRSELEAQARRLGVSDRVTFHGYLANPSDLYRRARCLALSSRYESFGNVIAEAMAHGLAVVTSAAAGPVEIVDHGRFGAVVPIGDAAGMAEAIDAALANPGDPAPRMARGREFSIEKAANAYLALAEEIIAEER